MKWRVIVTSPHLGRIERETEEWQAGNFVMDTVYQSAQAIFRVGLAVDVQISFVPLGPAVGADEPSPGGAGPTAGK
jgi:hypothetical protein